MTTTIVLLLHSFAIILIGVGLIIQSLVVKHLVQEIRKSNK